jgi:tripartite-type tricarboxylate transporter receptor subunit TctC
MKTRSFFRTLVGLFLATCSALTLAAYPDKPVRIIVPYAAGGPTDIAGRLVALELSKRLGGPFVVDNRAGAAGNIGADAVAKAAPDGYTLLVIGAAHAINKSLYTSLTYDVQRDFTMVAGISTAPMVMLTHTKSGMSSVQDVLVRAREKPGAMNYCSAGSGTAPHLAMESFKASTQAQITHVPYKGSAPCLTDLIAGQVDLCFDSLVVLQQHASSGKLRALAVTGSRRSDIAPDLPTMAEAGAPNELAVWYGLAAPARTPAVIVQTLNAHIREILAEPAVRERLRGLGAEPMVRSPGELQKFMENEIATWASVVKTSNAKID